LTITCLGACDGSIGVYDCVYVALAEREGCEMVTADARLLANIQPSYPFLISLASVP
jgi:predicted nucleic acid-binding protein